MVGANGGARFIDAATGHESRELSDVSLDEFHPVTAAKSGGAAPGRGLPERDVPRW